MEVFNAEAISVIEEVPGLYIAGITVPRDPEILRKHGITHVLSLTNQRDRPKIAEELGIDHLHVEIEDNPLEDLLMSLEGLCAWIDAALHSGRNTGKANEPTNGVDDANNDGGRIIPIAKGDAQSQKEVGSSLCSQKSAVLVHCVQGISRSGAIIVAYLMRMKSIDYESALALAQKSRSIITPNSGFADQLRLWQQMRYTIYANTSDESSPINGTKTKPQYEQWKADRGILLSRGEEAKQQVLRKSMADMAAIFGKRRIKQKEGSGP